MKGHVLIIEDDSTVSEIMKKYLTNANYRVTVASDGSQGIRAVLHATDRDGCGAPNLVVLDLGLPDIDGFDVYQALLERVGGHLPFIIVSGRCSEQDRVLGLEWGAADYISKPFSPRELVLRIDALLSDRMRKIRLDEAQLSVDGELRMDMHKREAYLRGKELSLTAREFDLLAFLVSHPGRAFTRTELIEKVWNWKFGDQSVVTVCVRRLRNKLESNRFDPRRISTVWGVGYRYDRIATVDHAQKS